MFDPASTARSKSIDKSRRKGPLFCLSTLTIAVSTLAANLTLAAGAQSLPGRAGQYQNDAPTYQRSRAELPVYYATTRLNDAGPGDRPCYGGARHLDFGEGSTEYGTALITAPAGYQSISTAPDWERLRYQMTAADNYFGVAPITAIRQDSQAEFYKRIANFHGLIVVYVHGYDMPFESALREMAELVQEMQARSPGLAILPIAFSWPSPGNKAAYSGDEASLEWSEKPFRQMINQIVRVKPADSNLDFVAHSMGSRYAFAYAQAKHPQEGREGEAETNVVQLPGLSDPSASKPPFRNIFLSCSDVDCHTAEARKESVQRCVSNKVYVFVNDNDGALFSSQILHQAPRLGRPVDPGSADKNAAFSTTTNSIIGGSPTTLFSEAETLLSEKAVSLFGQKARGFVNQLSSGAQTVLALPSQVSPEQSPEVTAWLARDPYLSRDWGPKSRLIDSTGFITLNMGHRLAWPLLAGLMLDPPQDAPFTFATINKKPDAAMMKVMGGSPTYLYRYDRIDLSRLRP
ncbi:MAG: alpha/beta hydrolase [Cyanobacteria bacterium REEB67]|nr:alpha/beta hydrolase [Cyanobacteria bacterium REEB67]